MGGGRGHDSKCALLILIVIFQFGCVSVLWVWPFLIFGRYDNLRCACTFFFFKGCDLINEQAAEGERLENFDVMLDVMDMDNNDSIDINEFFEVRAIFFHVFFYCINQQTPYSK